MAARKGGSRERLLDAAERLFGEQGYDATGTREIATQAGETLGSITYYFKTKDFLLHAVVERRLDMLQEARRNAFATAVQKAGESPPSLDHTIEAIVHPFLELALCGDPGWASYCAMGRLIYLGDSTPFQAVTDLIEPSGREMIGWLARAVPNAALNDVAYVFQFILSCTFGSISRNGFERLQSLTDGACMPFDQADMSRKIIRFIQAGAAAILAASTPEREGRI